MLADHITWDSTTSTKHLHCHRVCDSFALNLPASQNTGIKVIILQERSDN